MNTTRATAAKVEAAREEAGISRLALSNAAGIPRSTQNRMLDGHQSFTVEAIEAIARVIGVPPETLVDFRGAAA